MKRSTAAPYGILTDYDTGEELRAATADEHAQSLAARKIGAFEMNGRVVFVAGGPEPKADLEGGMEEGLTRIRQADAQAQEAVVAILGIERKHTVMVQGPWCGAPYQHVRPRRVSLHVREKRGHVQRILARAESGTTSAAEIAAEVYAAERETAYVQCLAADAASDYQRLYDVLSR